MSKQNIRWKQRFQNFEKSLDYLQQAMQIEQPDVFQKAGAIQFFEICFELSWNVIKDYLEEEGFTGLRSPRDTIKKAFETGLITGGHAWLQTLENRNRTSHTYDEAAAERVIKEIVKIHYPLLRKLYHTLQEKM
ncbi:MAG TPA: nucleotidyltransferase substrate binding protein [Saprospiraceae bacterium]|nr:nucleotidyltransferase substrate binding protein [Saprospiraceae bacterium]HMP15330.1 nucleotidyltransferase substrate binding protein [Saprospiraceae bacterium]